VGAVSSALFGKSAEGTVLGLLVLESKTLDDLGGLGGVLGKVNFGSGDAGLGLGGLGLLGTVTELVLQGERENSSEVLLSLLVVGSDTDGAGGAGGIVEASVGERVVGPLVAVELNEVGVVFPGKSPNNAVGCLHFLKNHNFSNFSHKKATSKALSARRKRPQITKISSETYLYRLIY